MIRTPQAADSSPALKQESPLSGDESGEVAKNRNG